jgi:hypothetical protein
MSESDLMMAHPTVILNLHLSVKLRYLLSICSLSKIKIFDDSVR